MFNAKLFWACFTLIMLLGLKLSPWYWAACDRILLHGSIRSIAHIRCSSAAASLLHGSYRKVDAIRSDHCKNVGWTKYLYFSIYD